MVSKIRRTRYCKTIVLAFAVVLILTILTTSLEAYSFNGSRISNKLTFVPHSSFGQTSVSHMNEAVYQWNYHSGKTLMSREPTLRHNDTAYPRKDGISRVYKVNAIIDYVAQCTYYSRNGVMTEADININAYYSWANSAQQDCFDLWTVFLHETGHAAGLSHSVARSSVMWSKVSTNMTKRGLQEDDRNGIRGLYS